MNGYHIIILEKMAADTGFKNIILNMQLLLQKKMYTLRIMIDYVISPFHLLLKKVKDLILIIKKI